MKKCNPRTFTTPLGEIHVKESGLIHGHLIPLEVTTEILEEHYVILEKELVEPKFPFVLTFKPSYLKMNAKSRRFNNEMMNKWATCMGVVVHNPLLRAFANMYIRIATLDYDILVFENFEKAEAWALSHSLNELKPTRY